MSANPFETNDTHSHELGSPNFTEDNPILQPPPRSSRIKFPKRKSPKVSLGSIKSPIGSPKAHVAMVEQDLLFNDESQPEWHNGNIDVCLFCVFF